MPKPKPTGWTQPIAGRRWTIKWVRMKGKWGLCLWPERIIQLHPDLLDHPDSLRNVYYHELDHALGCETEEARAEASAAAHCEADKKLAKYLDAPEDIA